MSVTNKRNFIILPNQLFENNYVFLNAYDNIYMIEDPHYFSTDEIKPNKIKIAYLRACMKYYHNDLIKNKINKNKIHYIEFSSLNLNSYPVTNADIYEITDFKLKEKYKKLGIHINEIQTPMFLMTRKQLDLYDRPTPSHSSFYEMTKKELGILEGIKNQDAYNRKNPKQEIQIDTSISYINPSTISYYKEGIEYSNSHLFKEHVGNATLENIKIYPITNKDAYNSFEFFLENNFKDFGKYQDVIQDTNPFMKHSLISPMLNNGLLNPSRLLEILKRYKNKISIEAYEGFIRQIIGWREYMRYLYLYKYELLIKSNNYKNNTKKIPVSWYNGTTGLIVIDNEIKKAITYGYSHHIIRLMVFLNFLLLTETKPYDIYKWFMEVVSIDAYDWVMVSNIYSMGHFSSIGMKRPYLSSSNYIIKMSNYKKDEKWNLIWDEKFRSFVKTNKINFYLRSIKK